jgi:hypothetical protein
MNDATVTSRASQLGIRSMPAVVIDGRLADCCAGRRPDEATLRAAALGQARTGPGCQAPTELRDRPAHGKMVHTWPRRTPAAARPSIS